MIDEETLGTISYFIAIIVFVVLFAYTLNRIQKLEQQYSSLNCTCYCETCDCCERRNVQYE